MENTHKPMQKYIVYATGDNGQGFVTQVGEFDSIEDIEIRVGMYNKDVVITIEKSVDNEATIKQEGIAIK